jgi:hypothetical protein
MQKLGHLVKMTKGVALKVLVTYPERVVCYMHRWEIELSSRRMGILEVPEDF